MLSFLEFYEALLTFINFKLYHTEGLVYPPPRVAALSPTSGPSDGNTSVTVLGGPFGLPEVTVTLGLRLGLR